MGQKERGNGKSCAYAREAKAPKALMLAQKREKRYTRAAIAAGVLLFLLTCLSVGASGNLTTMFVILAGIALMESIKYIAALAGLMSINLAAAVGRVRGNGALSGKIKP